MAWRVAKSLERLRTQVNLAAPQRSKTDDGTIGDESHSARESDHNPLNGVVHAMDLTHDPAGGFDSYKFAEALKASKDNRIKYVISNGRIWNPSLSPEWRSYGGANKHDRHVHISVKSDPALADSVADWSAVGGNVGPHVAAANVDAPRPTHPMLSFGSTDMENVALVWKLLQAQEPKSFGRILEAAVREYQKEKGLGVDGRVGSYTWGSLIGEKP